MRRVVFLSLIAAATLVACASVRMVPGAYTREQFTSIAFTRDAKGSVILTYQPLSETAAYSPGIEVKRFGGGVYVTIRRCYVSLPCVPPAIAVNPSAKGPYRVILAGDAPGAKVYLRNDGEWVELLESAP